LAALDGRPHSSSVIAFAASDIAKMAPARFLKVVQMYPGVALEIMVNLAGMVRNSTERIIDLSTLGANNRVHAELLRRAKVDGVEENGVISLSPVPVHSDMASRAGATRETVAWVLNDLARGGSSSGARTSW
jgi:CRP-like cAMP-binding protein